MTKRYYMGKLSAILNLNFPIRTDMDRYELNKDHIDTRLYISMRQNNYQVSAMRRVYYTKERQEG